MTDPEDYTELEMATKRKLEAPPCVGCSADFDGCCFYSGEPETMTTKSIGPVSIKTDPKTGKTTLQRVYKIAAGQRKNLHGKAKTVEDKWKAKSR